MSNKDLKKEVAVRRAGKRRFLDNITATLMVFAFICLCTSFVMKSSVYIKQFTVPSKGGMVGPLEVPKDVGVYKVEVGQKLKQNNWSYVYIEILNEQKQTVAAFGDEFWDEEGYESGTYWHESDKSFTSKIVLDKKGKYFFEVETETGNLSKAFDIQVKISRSKGSAIGFVWLFALSLTLGIITNEVNRQSIVNAISES